LLPDRQRQLDRVRERHSRLIRLGAFLSHKSPQQVKPPAPRPAAFLLPLSSDDGGSLAVDVCSHDGSMVRPMGFHFRVGKGAAFPD
jgi:hypothetical protein